jgi:hypothetical protein
MNPNLGNYRTTICGALAVLLTAAASIPGLEAYAKIFGALATLVGALGLYFAKDATTGSAPR